MILPALHIVTSDAILARGEFGDIAARLLRRGRARIAFHLRGPAATGRRLWELASALGDVARECAAWLIVNDRLDIARAARARGLQLGARSVATARARPVAGSGLCVGRSVHSVAEASAAVADGSDFLLLGTIYASPSHPSQPAAGTDLMRSVVRTVPVPVIGIGGMTPERATEVLAAGGHGVAVLSGIWNGPEPERALDRFLAALTPADGHAEASARA